MGTRPRPRPRQAETAAAGALSTVLNNRPAHNNTLSHLPPFPAGVTDNGRRGIHAAEPCPEQGLLKIFKVEEGPEEGASNVGPRGRRVRHFRGIESAEPEEGRWRGRRVRLHVLRRVLH